MTNEEWLKLDWKGDKEISIEEYECVALESIKSLPYIYKKDIIGIVRYPEVFGYKPKKCSKIEMIKIFTNTIIDLYSEIL